MPVIKGKSKYPSKSIVMDSDGRPSLHKLEKHYDVDVRENKNEQNILSVFGLPRILEHGGPPVRIRTKTGRIIYLHANIEPKYVLAYEEFYKELENKVKSGELKYNPYARMLFKEMSDGNYVAVAEDVGESLVQLVRNKKQSQINWINVSKGAIDLLGILQKLGYKHGHLGGGNICIDHKGRLRLIDISMLEKTTSYFDVIDIVEFIFGLMPKIASHEQVSEEVSRRIKKDLLEIKKYLDIRIEYLDDVNKEYIEQLWEYHIRNSSI